MKFIRPWNSRNFARELVRFLSPHASAWVFTGDIFDQLPGGKCGSTAVDRNFYALMSKRFGAAFDNLPIKRKSPGSDFMKKFEIIKRDFGHSDEETTFELPLNMTLQDPDPDYFDEEERLVIISR